MKFYIISLLLLISPIFAQENLQENRAVVDELLELTKFESTAVDSAMKAFDGAISQNKKDISKNGLKEIEKQARIFYTEIFSDLNLKNQIKAMYIKHFTDEELLTMIDFYKTPAGQKTIDLTPTIISNVLEATMEKVKPKMAEFQMKMLEIIKNNPAEN